MPSEPVGADPVESFISEAQRIYSEHCDPNNPSGWLSDDDRRTVPHGLHSKGMALEDYLRPRITFETAASWVSTIEDRVRDLIRWTELLVAKGPDHRGYEDNLRCLRRDFGTTDLALLFANLRQAAGVVVPKAGISTEQSDKASIRSYLNAKTRLLAKRDSWRVYELPSEFTPEVLRVLDDRGWIEFRVWHMELVSMKPFEDSPSEARPFEGERGWFSPKRDPYMAGDLEKVLRKNGDNRLLATEVRVTPAKRAELKVADEAARRFPPNSKASTASVSVAGGSPAERQVHPATLAKAILFEDPAIAANRLAKKVGVSAGTLYKKTGPWKDIRAILMARDKERVLGGRKDSEGDLDAFDDD